MYGTQTVRFCVGKVIFLHMQGRRCLQVQRPTRTNASRWSGFSSSGRDGACNLDDVAGMQPGFGVHRVTWAACHWTKWRGAEGLVGGPALERRDWMQPASPDSHSSCRLTAVAKQATRINQA